MEVDEWTAREVVERAGVIRATHVSPDDAFTVRLLDTMETYDDVVNNIGYIDDVAFRLRFAEEPDDEEQTVIAAVIYEWRWGEQNRICDEEPENAYGWFHRIGVVTFDGAVADWYIDTSCQGVKWQSLVALQEWMVGTPGPCAMELVLGWSRKEKPQQPVQNGIWQLWSKRTSNLMEEFTNEDAARAAIRQILANSGPAYLDEVTMLHGSVHGGDDLVPVGTGAELAAWALWAFSVRRGVE